MLAVVKYANEPDAVELREVPEPEPGPGEVIVEVKAAGVCGSDIEMWKQDISWTVNVPVILGHEFAGVIAQVGEGVEGWDVGDRVVCETAAYICGRCPMCRQGLYNLCPGRLGFGYGTDGAFAKYVAVPERVLHRLPDSIPFEEAALTEPACVAYNALVVNTRIRPGEPCVILGPGPVGLFALQIARACGACPILVTGTSADTQRLEVAIKLGADIVVNIDEQDAVAAVRDITRGLGAPVVVDCVGRTPTLAQSLQMVAPAGQITKIGWGPQPAGVSLDPIIQKGARLQGTFSHTWRTWEAVINMVAHGRLNMRAMISDVMPLSRWREAFERVHSRQAVKIILRPE